MNKVIHFKKFLMRCNTVSHARSKIKLEREDREKATQTDNITRQLQSFTIAIHSSCQNKLIMYIN